MLFTAVLAVGSYLWRRSEERRLGIEWIPMSFNPRFHYARVKGFHIPAFTVPALFGLEEFEVRPSDVWLCSFPKSGTTWTQELVWLLANDCNFSTAKSVTLDDRSPFIEFPGQRPVELIHLPSPRVLVTHIPFALLPRDVREGKCKIVYVMRNPKDVTVSIYHFLKGLVLIPAFESIAECARSMIDGTVNGGPYWTHLQQFWEQRHKAHVFINTYEQMQQDLPGTVRDLARFLGKQLTEEQVEQVVRWCSFSNMKSNPMANKTWDPNIQTTFMRKGVVGDWKNQLTPEISAQFDAAYEQHLKPLGIDFDFGDD